MAYFDITGTKGMSVRIHWSESCDIVANTSIVSITKIQFLMSQYYGDTYYFTGSVSINGKTMATMNSTQGYYKTPYIAGKNTWYDIVIESPGIALPWTSGSISHNSDGTGSTTISVSLSGYTVSGNNGSGASVNVSQPITLTTIPRGSSLSLDKTSVDVEGTITANITRASNSFTHTVEFYIDNNYYQKYTNVATSQSYTIPTSWYNYLSHSTSCTAYCSITTYSGSTRVGQTRTSFTVNVPDNIVPTIGTISLDPSDINGYNILVKGKNALTLSISGSTAGIGSSIKSYTFSGPSISTTTINNYVTIPSVSSVGTLTYNVTVTDTRDRSASTSGTIVCYDYYSPFFTSFNAYRADSDGTQNLNGTYLMCTYGTMHASVNATNSVAVTVYYNNKSVEATDGSILIDLNGDTTTTYKVHLKVIDTYGGSNTSTTLTIFAQARILNITADGTGIAIGKMADSSNLFECRWDAVFNGAVSGPSGFSTSSDARVKKNVKDLDIDIVDSLRPVQYELANSKDTKVHYGFIAQEVEELLTCIGLDSESMGIIGHVMNGGENQYVLTYTEFVPLLTKKCQLLQAETNMLRQEINELKAMIKGRD